MHANERLRSAVIGTGFIGPQHVDAVRRGGYGEVVALVDLDLERTKAVARALGIPTATTDIDEVLRDPDIDVVHVCTPNRTHVEIATSVLEAGKHLVVEKPVATDRAGAAKLLSLAERSGKHAAVSLTYRGYPMVRQAHQIVQDGRLGSLRLAYGGYTQDWLADANDYNWRLETSAAGPSRAFADIGTHWFDTVEYMTGVRAESVLADLATFVPVRHRPKRATATFASSEVETEEVVIDTEDGATILVRFVGGGRGSLVVSQVSPGHKNGLTVEIAGSKRSLSWEQEDPERLWLRSRDESTLLRREPMSGAAGNGATPGLPAGHPEGWGEALRDLLRPFYAAIASGDPIPVPGDNGPYPSLADGARGVALIDAVIESSRTESWTRIADIKAAAAIAG